MAEFREFVGFVELLTTLSTAAREAALSVNLPELPTTLSTAARAAAAAAGLSANFPGLHVGSTVGAMESDAFEVCAAA